MARYGAQFERPTPASNTTVGSVGSSSALHRRGSVELVYFGSKGAPSDAAFRLTAARYATSPGTSTLVIPNPLVSVSGAPTNDPGDAAFSGEAGRAHSVEPTYFSPDQVVLAATIVGRSAFRWESAPGAGLTYPAAAGSRLGLGFKTPVVGAIVPLNLTLIVEEA